MNKLLLFLAFGVITAFGSAAGVETPRVVHGKTFITYGKSSKDIPLTAEQERGFTIDAAIAADVFQTGAPSIIINDFPVGVSEVKTIELRPARPVVDGTTKWMKNGKIPMPAPTIISYEGKVDGESTSRVFLTYFKGDVTGMVERGNGQRYVVSPDVKNYDSKRAHVLTNSANVENELEQLGQFCGTPDDVPVMEKDADHVLADDGSLREASLAAEATNTFYKKFNDYDKTAAYMASLFGMVSRIYEDEVNVVLHLEIVNIWEDVESDPYKGMSSAEVMLDKMRQYWNQNITNPRSLAHLVAGPYSGGGGGTYVKGIARLAALCNQNTAYGVSIVNSYNVSLPSLTYQNDVFTIAHEIGHNFGSPHTHSTGYNPPIDSCVTRKPGSFQTGDGASSGDPKPPANGIGTIMSYCHLQFANTVQNSFGPKPRAVIRAASAGCLPPPAVAVIYMQYPVGKQNLVAGNMEEIRWTSARVTNVKVQYSIDGGATWIDINTNVPATTRKITWTVPTVSTTSLLVKVSDVSNGNVYDQTEANLSIAAAALSLTNPTGGERIGNKESLTITWNKQLISSVNVEFSANGGESWTIVASGLTGSSYTWKDLPSTPTSNAVIRVTDANNGSLVSQSDLFAIGVATATITSPNGGVNDKFAKGYNLGIVWTADFVSKIFIDYSTDNGTTWKSVKTVASAVPFDASIGSYNWVIPATADTATGKVLIRIRNAGGDKEELDRTDEPFTIDLVSSVDDVMAESNGLSLIGVSPNPSGDEAYVKFTASEILQGNSLQIELINVTGQVVSRFERGNQFTSGEQTVKLDLREMPQGVYLLVIKSGMTQVSAPLQIVR